MRGTAERIEAACIRRGRSDWFRERERIVVRPSLVGLEVEGVAAGLLLSVNGRRGRRIDSVLGCPIWLTGLAIVPGFRPDDRTALLALHCLTEPLRRDP
jgi:hypothetical protein